MQDNRPTPLQWAALLMALPFTLCGLYVMATFLVLYLQAPGMVTSDIFWRVLLERLLMGPDFTWTW